MLPEDAMKTRVAIYGEYSEIMTTGFLCIRSIHIRILQLELNQFIGILWTINSILLFVLWQNCYIWQGCMCADIMLVKIRQKCVRFSS